MAKKEFKFHGLSVEEVKKLSKEEFLALIPARERRSLKRGPSEGAKKVMEHIARGRKTIRTHEREMVLTPEMIGTQIQIYTGKAWEKVDITLEMMGHRLGEFALTRKRVAHSNPGVGATRSSAAMSVR